jgi:hypothetical protein
MDELAALRARQPATIQQSAGREKRRISAKNRRHPHAYRAKPNRGGYPSL